ncbi:PCYCGC motif-containing (lipo)protein [Ureibacillus aquaedulcis]|uniref:PCYCGC motif-containing (Lipo)protein n=1 Tax=Ureibacillus aquaedulcis TaxID=3058421 RepID=A0ABT8GS29_9BACL|nr:PCYCGC motif-containing (lipo)protein [Ureibacillus sp. BA0131]MDN4494225.1 PCYCGC motif-containing (lipo)protein [Ureibacillus sp. BA0131]
MKKLFPLFASIVLILSACGNSAKDEHSEDEHANHESSADVQIDNAGTEDAHSTHNHTSGDIQELTASADELPKFLDDQNEDIRLVYQVAGKATDILQWIPCYCGCGESVGHRSNLNCFIAETREDGSILWDDHGTRCLVCLEIAVESVQMAQEGKSLKEIRNAIDAKYQEGYAAPTPTEMPA